MSQDKRQRLFFALWPDETLRRQLKQLLVKKPFQAIGARPVPPENFHITLRYLGSLPESQRQCAERVADNIHADSFQLVLDQVGYWRDSGVVWLGASNAPLTLFNLVKALETGLESCALEPESRFYQPHLTFLRKACPDALPSTITPIVWQADRFVLVHSVTLPEGVQYKVVRSWSLSG